MNLNTKINTMRKIIFSDGSYSLYIIGNTNRADD